MSPNRPSTPANNDKSVKPPKVRRKNGFLRPQQEISVSLHPRVNVDEVEAIIVSAPKDGRVVVVSLEPEKVVLRNRTPYITAYILLVVPKGAADAAKIAMGAAGAVARGEATPRQALGLLVSTIFGL